MCLPDVAAQSFLYATVNPCICHCIMSGISKPHHSRPDAVLTSPGAAEPCCIDPDWCMTQCQISLLLSHFNISECCQIMSTCLRVSIACTHIHLQRRPHMPASAHCMHPHIPVSRLAPELEIQYCAQLCSMLLCLCIHHRCSLPLQNPAQ